MNRIEVNLETGEQRIVELTQEEIDSLPMSVAPSYKELRAQAYPPLQDLADGIVKQHSDDPIIKAEGDAQVADYAAKCLAIKASIPKETA